MEVILTVVFGFNLFFLLSSSFSLSSPFSLTNFFSIFPELFRSHFIVVFFDICLHIKLDCGFEGHLKCIILDTNSISVSTASHNACRVYTSLYTCSWACPACTTSRCYEFDLQMKGRENQCSSYVHLLTRLSSI